MYNVDSVHTMLALHCIIELYIIQWRRQLKTETYEVTFYPPLFRTQDHSYTDTTYYCKYCVHTHVHSCTHLDHWISLLTRRYLNPTKLINTINTLRSVHIALVPQTNDHYQSMTCLQLHKQYLMFIHACACTHITHHMTNSSTSHLCSRTGRSITQVIHVTFCIKACMPNSTSRSCFACLSTLTCAASK